MISLLCPSRGRPDQLLEMWHSAYETATDPGNLELVVRVDDDDRSYDQLRNRGSRARTDEPFPRQLIRWVSLPRDRQMSALWNDAWRVARGDILMHCADDIRFREPAWDLCVEMQFSRLPADRIGYVYGRDGAHDQQLGTHGFLSQEWTQVIGYFLPPYFSCDYADTWLNEVAEAIGRRVYDPAIFTEHMHPALGKGEVDQTHRDRFERDAEDNNTQRWHELAPKRVEWILKLQDAIEAAG